VLFFVEVVVMFAVVVVAADVVINVVSFCCDAQDSIPEAPL
jgi:hypothetical protein